MRETAREEFTREKKKMVKMLFMIVNLFSVLSSSLVSSYASLYTLNGSFVKTNKKPDMPGKKEKQGEIDKQRSSEGVALESRPSLFPGEIMIVSPALSFVLYPPCTWLIRLSTSPSLLYHAMIFFPILLSLSSQELTFSNAPRSRLSLCVLLNHLHVFIFLAPPCTHVSH